MKVLVTGGAGYIGSFMTSRLLDDGHTVVVADSLERGYKDAVDHRATFVKGDLLDRVFVDGLFNEHVFDGVMHFAAYISMGESMQKPGMYFENNVQSAVNLLEAMAGKGVKKFIFSSTAGVYGNPEHLPIPEDHPKRPTNPYGESKLLVEQILPWYQEIHDIGFVCLRYFNAAGAATDGSKGEQHLPESHLIPNIIHAVMRDEAFTLFGSDYDTPDGTCIRDYIHVLDLVEAHMLALLSLEKGEARFYNVGTGKGYSNKEVIGMVEKVTTSRVDVLPAKKRPGDAGTLVADVAKIKKELGFTAKYSDLETIVITAWEWHRKYVRDNGQ